MLARYIEQQNKDYETALSDVKSGRKTSEWEIGAIFPYLSGLKPIISNPEPFGIRNLDEAKELLAHPILGTHLIEITTVLVELAEYDAKKIFGNDYLKVWHSMTLFHVADPDNRLFTIAIYKYFDGQLADKTIQLLR